MKLRRSHRLLGAGLAVGCLTLALNGPAWATEPEGRPSQPPAPPISLQEAPQRARMLHAVYAATLDAMHHHYFQANKSVLPARALEDVFEAVAAETQATAKWISVNTRAMSIDHEPSTEFEKKAAAELSTGKPEHSAVEDGIFRRAAAIPLSAGCVSCHAGLGASQKVPRFAGLIISIPVSE